MEAPNGTQTWKDSLGDEVLGTAAKANGAATTRSISIATTAAVEEPIAAKTTTLRPATVSPAVDEKAAFRQPLGYALPNEPPSTVSEVGRMGGNNNSTTTNNNGNGLRNINEKQAYYSSRPAATKPGAVHEPGTTGVSSINHSTTNAAAADENFSGPASATHMVTPDKAEPYHHNTTIDQNGKAVYSVPPASRPGAVMYHNNNYSNARPDNAGRHKEADTNHTNTTPPPVSTWQQATEPSSVVLGGNSSKSLQSMGSPPRVGGTASGWEKKDRGYSGARATTPGAVSVRPTQEKNEANALDGDMTKKIELFQSPPAARLAAEKQHLQHASEPSAAASGNSRKKEDKDSSESVIVKLVESDLLAKKTMAGVGPNTGTSRPGAVAMFSTNNSNVTPPRTTMMLATEPSNSATSLVNTPPRNAGSAAYLDKKQRGYAGPAATVPGVVSVSSSRNESGNEGSGVLGYSADGDVRKKMALFQGPTSARASEEPQEPASAVGGTRTEGDNASKVAIVQIVESDLLAKKSMAGVGPNTGTSKPGAVAMGGNNKSNVASPRTTMMLATEPSNSATSLMSTSSTGGDKKQRGYTGPAATVPGVVSVSSSRNESGNEGSGALGHGGDGDVRKKMALFQAPTSARAAEEPQEPASTAGRPRKLGEDTSKTAIVQIVESDLLAKKSMAGVGPNTGTSKPGAVAMGGNNNSNVTSPRTTMMLATEPYNSASSLMSTPSTDGDKKQRGYTGPAATVPGVVSVLSSRNESGNEGSEVGGYSADVDGRKKMLLFPAPTSARAGEEPLEPASTAGRPRKEGEDASKTAIVQIVESDLLAKKSMAGVGPNTGTSQPGAMAMGGSNNNNVISPRTTWLLATEPSNSASSLMSTPSTSLDKKARDSAPATAPGVVSVWSMSTQTQSGNGAVAVGQGGDGEVKRKLALFQAAPSARSVDSQEPASAAAAGSNKKNDDDSSKEVIVGMVESDLVIKKAMTGPNTGTRQPGAMEAGGNNDGSIDYDRPIGMKMASFSGETQPDDEEYRSDEMGECEASRPSAWDKKEMGTADAMSIHALPQPDEEDHNYYRSISYKMRVAGGAADDGSSVAELEQVTSSMSLQSEGGATGRELDIQTSFNMEQQQELIGYGYQPRSSPRSNSLQDFEDCPTSPHSDKETSARLTVMSVTSHELLSHLTSGELEGVGGGKDLAVAMEVDEEAEKAKLIRAEDFELNRSASVHRRNRLIVLLTCFFFLSIGSIIAAVVVSQNNRDDATADEDLLWNSPTMSPTTGPTTSLEAELRSWLLNEKNVSVAAINSSPVAFDMAVRWYANVDRSLNLSLADPWDYQRFLLIWYYYASSGNGTKPWLSCNPPDYDAGQSDTCTWLNFSAVGNELDYVTFNQTPGTPRWLSNYSHCDWPGVRCMFTPGTIPPDDDLFLCDGAASTLQLISFGLSGRLPIMINQFPCLAHYLVGYNSDLTGPIPPEMFDFRTDYFTKYMSDLAIYNNSHMSGPIPNALWDLNLIELNLADNGFTGTLPDLSAKLPLLENLLLHGNNFSGPLPVLNGKALKMLRLQRSGFNGTIPEVYGNYWNLKDLWLFDNLLTGTIPSSIWNFFSMETFRVDRNQLRGSFPDVFWENATVIQLSVNQLEGELPSGLAEMTNLEQLFLDENNFSGQIDSGFFTKLVKLKDVSLFRNNFTGPIPASLVGLQQLTLLQLDRNNFEGDVPFELCLGRDFFDAAQMNDFSADCLGNRPKNYCHCCTTCCYTDGDFQTCQTTDLEG